MIEQSKLALTPKNNRRYFNMTFILAASIYMHSTSAYNALLNCKMLFMPSIRLLQNMISKYSMSNHTLLGSVKYLESKMKYLKKHELLVNLLLDEIYIERQFDFKGGSIYGGNEITSSNAAKTAQVFMISSILSCYKDVVCIVPVDNLKSNYLKDMILSVINELEKIGFKIISLISDNNAVNRKAFEMMSPNQLLQPFIIHPIDKTRLLFSYLTPFI